MLGNLGEALNLPVMQKLRRVHQQTRPGTRERVKACAPIVGELERTIEPLIMGAGLQALALTGKALNRNFPTAQTIRSHFEAFKRKLRTEPAFVRTVCDVLPSLAGRYDAGSALDIVRDPEFLRLLEEAAK